MAQKTGNMALKVALPIAIGVGVAAYMFSREYTPSMFASVHFGARAWIGIAVALLFVTGRDFGLAWRFHTIAYPDLSWGRALRVDLMCAFTSAITPSAVGGSALAVFYLNTEGVKVGRAAALTLTTLFLDELFFVVFCPVIALFVPMSDLFGPEVSQSGFMQGVEIVFWVVYGGIVAYTGLLYLGILRKPELVSRLLRRIFSVKPLRRWLPKVESMTANMVATSQWIKKCPRSWWAKVFGATTLSWFSRYLVVSALFWGLAPGAPWLLIFARQFVVWVVLMVSPTPGSSGISEWMFTEYYGDLVGSCDVSLIIAMIWRIITYYIYLAIGSVMIATYFKGKKPADATTQKSNKYENS